VNGVKVERPGPSPILKGDRGCFVTLHKYGQLQGCIGTIELGERAGRTPESTALGYRRTLNLGTLNLGTLNP